MVECYDSGLYLRVSVEDDGISANSRDHNYARAESVSIENQRDILTEYAKLNGWNIYKIYTDDGFSGGSFERPAFKEMIADARAGKINLILVKDLSRFGRDHVEVDHYVENVFPGIGVRFIALMDGLDSEGDIDFLPFRSLLNDFYLKDLSRKVKQVYIAKAKDGHHLGAIPYGYMGDPDKTGHLIIDPDAANVVRRIFDLMAQGMGKRTIAATLNNEGILTPRSHIAIRHGVSPENLKECVWLPSRISVIAKNEAYLGHTIRMRKGHLSYKNHTLVDKDESEWIRVENTHEPIISQEVWDKVLERRRSSKSSVRKANIVCLFAGLLRCSDGHWMQSGYRSTRDKKAHIVSYHCGIFVGSGRSCCTSHTISELALLNIVRSDLEKQLASVALDERTIVAKIKGQLRADSIKDLESEKKVVQVKLDVLDGQAVGLYEDRLVGKISLDEFKVASDEISTALNILLAEQSRLLDFITRVSKQVETSRKWVSDVRSFLSMETPDRETLAELVEKIVVGTLDYDRSTKTRRQDVKIYYRFAGVSEISN